jgi:ABC-type transport system substrate-binding protein
MRFDILIQDAEQAISIQKSAENYRKAEKHVLEQAWFIPICFQTEYFFMNRDCKDILHNPFTGSVIFQYAKYFG